MNKLYEVRLHYQPLRLVAPLRDAMGDSNMLSTIRVLNFFVLLVCGACASMASEAPGVTKSTMMQVSGPELLVIFFKEGRPRKGDTLLDSVSDVQFTEFALDRDMEIIKKFPQLQFQVSGSTDNKECAPETCSALSLRRANLVNNWFLGHGVKASSLKEPIGRGDEAPLTDNASEKARSVNRRAVVNFVINEEQWS